MKQKRYLRNNLLMMIGVGIGMGILFAISASNAYGVLTNKNEVTNFFDENIENKEELLKILEDGKNDSKTRIENKEGASFLPGRDEMNNKIDELNAISPYDLEDAGVKARQSDEYQFYDAGKFELDHEDKDVKRHKKDIDKIIEWTDDTLKDLQHMIKKLGIADCKTVKGPKQIEPTFYIEVKDVPAQNAEFDQVFCEDLRSTYNCSDTLTLRCIERGIKWENWQNREMLISGNYIFNQHSNWLYVIRPKKGYWLMHTSNSDGRVKDQVRHHIAGTLGVGVDHIDPNVAIGHTGEGNIYNIRDKCHVWDNYRVKYRYRDSKPICVKWDGDQNGWNERCFLK